MCIYLYCWAAPHRPIRPRVPPASRPKKSPVGDRDINGLMDGGPYMSEKRSWSDLRGCWAGRGGSLYSQRKGNLPLKRELDCLFMLFMEFLWQEYCSGSPCLPSGDRVLSELLTMTHPSGVALHGIAHSFIESGKPFAKIRR